MEGSIQAPRSSQCPDRDGFVPQKPPQFPRSHPFAGFTRGKSGLRGESKGLPFELGLVDVTMGFTPNRSKQRSPTHLLAMRILLVLILATLTGIAGWWTVYLKGKIDGHSQELQAKDQRIAKLGDQLVLSAEELKVSEAQRRQLELSNHLLKIDHRVARITVLEQGPNPEDPESLITTIRFQELDDAGEPIGEGQEITVGGTKVYLETLVIKFDDEFVEGGDFLRGSSVCLFKRVFGEEQKPSSGEIIDAQGVHPHPYAKPGDSEDDLYYAELWQNFWEYANNPELAASKGVRTMGGEAPFVQTRPGKVYRVELRASGGLSINPE